MEGASSVVPSGKLLVESINVEFGFALTTAMNLG